MTISWSSLKVVTLEARCTYQLRNSGMVTRSYEYIMLKIYHMQEQVKRRDATPEHISKCQSKLAVLLEQKADMQLAFDEMMEDIGNGNRRFKVYRQMKMYNDPSMNPMLYKNKE